jgi:glycosyltransferase involved in cell wall biosynthesis
VLRFLLINQYYAPDVAPTGRVLGDVARTLSARGHEVEVFTSRAAYAMQAGSESRPAALGASRRYAASPPDPQAPNPAREERDGVVVRRLPAPRLGAGLAGRLSQQSVFLAALTGALAGARRADLVLSLTTPPYVGLVARAVANLRGAAHAHWVMDVYPDALAAHGWLAPAGLPFRMLQSLARLQVRGAALVFGLGPVQAARLAAYTGGEVPWVPLWSSGAAAAGGEAIARVRAERGWTPGELVLLYSGNFGRGHTLDEFLEAARRLGAAGPRWAFCGGGERAAEVADLRRRHPDARLQSFPYVPADRLAETLGAGDVHLVSVRAAWQGLIVPSKVQAAFSAGRPVLMVGGRDNEAAQWIEASGGGWRVDEGDVDALLAAIEQAGDATERARRGQRALACAREHFDRDRNCARIAGLLEEAASGR